MGLQLRPMGTARPVRSRPTSAATAEAAEEVEGTTLAQHWFEVGGVTGGPFQGMAAARVCNKEVLVIVRRQRKRHTMRAAVAKTESLENMFVIELELRGLLFE
jgi:hypothetical protein